MRNQPPQLDRHYNYVDPCEEPEWARKGRRFLKGYAKHALTNGLSTAEAIQQREDARDAAIAAADLDRRVQDPEFLARQRAMDERVANAMKSKKER